jgi:hypothetical protein
MNRTLDEFLALVETDLQLRHVPFDLAELRTFLTDIWPLVDDADLPETWATAFVQATVQRGGATG